MRPIEVRGVEIPRIIYGTAWKEDQTAGLVKDALESGFRAIDTANQRKHYFEAGVGDALRRWGSDETRSKVFLQTKFTHIDGQDDRLPYDSDAPIETQVRQSFESSLEHLGVESIDSLLIHGPSSRNDWIEMDVAVWRTMEELVDAERVRLIGVSNVPARQVEILSDIARIPPAFVQNRCYAALGWDSEVRAICEQKGIVYQGFSLLTANAPLFRHPPMIEMARRREITVAQLIFAFAAGVGMLPLTGTTSRAHMAEDLEAVGIELETDELETIESIALRR